MPRPNAVQQPALVARARSIDRLRTTNPIENLKGTIAHFTRNVKRWKDGQMTLRWIADAFSDAKGRFPKLRGRRDTKPLLAALTATSASVIDAD